MREGPAAGPRCALPVSSTFAFDSVLIYRYTYLMPTDPREIIAYQGPCFTVEWFHDENGHSEALDYYNQLSSPRRRKLLVLLKRMGDVGTIFNKTKFRHEGDQIYVFKPHPDRFFMFLLCRQKDHYHKRR